MAITKEQKVEILAELDGAFANAASVAFVQFSGLGSNDTNDLRSQLFENGVTYRVVKKTLLKRAIETSSATGDLPALEGNVAIAWSTEDATAAPREVYNFAQDHDGALKIVGGVFENGLKNEAEMNEIATIPSMDALRGMFANVINSPIQGFVVALGQIAAKKEEA